MAGGDDRRGREPGLGIPRGRSRWPASWGCASIAFPAISTGIFGFPVERAAPIAVETARRAAAATATVRDVRFVLFSPRDLAVFQQAAAALGA